MTITILAATAPSPAIAATLILRCKGVEEHSSTGARASWKYYEISKGYWYELDKYSGGWSGNRCALAKAKCEIEADAYHLSYPSGVYHGDQDVTISRDTGEVTDVLTESGATITFKGQCKRSENPLPPAAPRY